MGVLRALLRLVDDRLGGQAIGAKALADVAAHFGHGVVRQALGSDEHPALRLTAAAHLEPPDALFGERPLGVLRRKPDQQLVCADPNREVATDHEPDPAEHLLLDDVRPGRDVVPDPAGQRLVVGHGRNLDGESAG